MIGSLGTARARKYRPGGATRDVVCVVTACSLDAIPESPVALCPKHLREAFEFGSALVDGRVGQLVHEAAEALTSGRPTPPPVLPERNGQPGWVYFIRFGERIKIGYSTTPYRRIAALPHDAVLGLIPGSLHVEHDWHRRFKASRVVGEWFHATADLLLAIGAATAEVA